MHSFQTTLTAFRRELLGFKPCLSDFAWDLLTRSLTISRVIKTSNGGLPWTPTPPTVIKQAKPSGGQSKAGTGGSGSAKKRDDDVGVAIDQPAQAFQIHHQNYAARHLLIAHFDISTPYKLSHRSGWDRRRQRFLAIAVFFVSMGFTAVYRNYPQGRPKWRFWLRTAQYSESAVRVITNTTFGSGGEKPDRAQPAAQPRPRGRKNRQQKVCGNREKRL